MSDTYEFFQQGRAHLKRGMPAQATVPLEKAKRLEPQKASIREANGHYKLARSLRPGNEEYGSRVKDLRTE